MDFWTFLSRFRVISLCFGPVLTKSAQNGVVCVCRRGSHGVPPGCFPCVLAVTGPKLTKFSKFTKFTKLAPNLVHLAPNVPIWRQMSSMGPYGTPHMPMWSHTGALSTGLGPCTVLAVQGPPRLDHLSGTPLSRSSYIFGFWLGLRPGQNRVWTPIQGVIFPFFWPKYPPFGPPCGPFGPPGPALR